MFRGNNRDDSISYRDWRVEIESALAKGYSAEQVKLAMFEALEDMPKQHAYSIDSIDILENMDELYGVKMTFQALNAALCGLQQWPFESCRDYYDRMVQITVLLRERHSSRFRPGELTRMTKEYFYAGLWPEHHPIVVHLKDKPNASCMSLLIALQENKQNDVQTRTRYPANTTPHPNGQAQPHQADRPAECKPVQLDHEEDGYSVHPIQMGVEPEEDYGEEEPVEDPDMNHWMDQGFHIGMVQAADSADAQFRCCFNCFKEGHHWRESTKLPLLPELQEILDREALNQKGGAGGKGGSALQQKKGNDRQCDWRPSTKNPQ